MGDRDDGTQEWAIVRALVQATGGRFFDWPIDTRVAVIERAIALLEDETIWASASK